jgi:ribosome modulation factor
MHRNDHYADHCIIFSGVKNMTDIEKARNDGYTAGLTGGASLPGNYMRKDELRRAYEAGYDIGRAARKSEKARM